MAFNIDLHCHSLFSGDGVSRPEELINAARIKGLHAFVITDHNTCDAIDYMIGKGLMNEEGTPVNDMLVVPGVEVTTEEGHLLCVGAALPEPEQFRGKPAREVCEAIHDVGGLAIPPHPFDLFRAGIRPTVLETLPIDALEVFNAATTLRRYNKLAYKYAQMRNLPMTAASDAHHAAAIGTAYTILDIEQLTVKHVLEGICRGAELSQRYMTAGEAVRKTWQNWMRFRRKPVQVTPDDLSRLR